jgi:superfamily II RNA helicase
MVESMEGSKKEDFVHIFCATDAFQEPEKEEYAMHFPYELDIFQKRGIRGIMDEEDVFITAHTGSGKTVLALYAIAHCMQKGKRVIYTSPIKSLSNQKYAEFTEKFGKESIGILTGDIKMNPDAPCLIMTTEILRNLLYKEYEKNIFPTAAERGENTAEEEEITEEESEQEV